MIALILALTLGPPTPIEGPERLSRFVSAVRALDAGGQRVRITHLGDSHVVADLWSGPIRDALQARHGNGGRGFVLAGRPWSSYFQTGLDNGAGGPWRVDGFRSGLDDGWFGPGFCSMAATDPRAVVRVAARAGGTRWVDVHHLRQPGGGCFEVRVDDRPVGRVSTRGPWVEPAFARFDVPDGGQRISVHPVGGGEVRLAGLDLGGERGVVYDALGINGARADRLLRLDPRALTDGLRRLDPQLLVISYGTNELFDSDLDPEAYAARLDRVLARLRAAVPGADCLLTGPPDARRRRRPLPLMDRVIGIQRALSEAHGCAFWDTRAAMGGPGAIERWKRARLARADRVHLTRDGYARLAEALLASLQMAGLPADEQGIVRP